MYNFVWGKSCSTCNNFMYIWVSVFMKKTSLSSTDMIAFTHTHTYYYHTVVIFKNIKTATCWCNKIIIFMTYYYDTESRLLNQTLLCTARKKQVGVRKRRALFADQTTFPYMSAFLGWTAAHCFEFYCKWKCAQLLNAQSRCVIVRKTSS